jgi:hypothetical protein
MEITLSFLVKKACARNNTGRTGFVEQEKHTSHACCSTPGTLPPLLQEFSLLLLRAFRDMPCFVSFLFNLKRNDKFKSRNYFLPIHLP